MEKRERSKSRTESNGGGAGKRELLPDPDKQFHYYKFCVAVILCALLNKKNVIECFQCVSLFGSKQEPQRNLKGFSHFILTRSHLARAKNDVN